MKKVLFTAVVGALLLTVGGMTASNVDHTEAASNDSRQGNQSHYISSEVTLTSLPEYTTVAKKVDLKKYSAQIMQDNSAKRVIVFKASNGREQYKSVFIKNQKRLKVVDYKGGLIFNQSIGANVQPTRLSVSSEATQTPESKKLSSTVNLSNYSTKVVENNKNKRITLYKDAKGHAQYKTIFVKKTGIVKVITL